MAALRLYDLREELLAAHLEHLSGAGFVAEAPVLRQKLEFLAVFRFYCCEMAAVGRKDAADLQPFGDGDHGCIDVSDVRIAVLFQER